MPSLTNAIAAAHALSGNLTLPTIHSHLPSHDILLTGTPTSGSLIAFLALQLLGAHVMLPILLITFLTTRVRRHPALLNLFFVFSAIGVVCCLLLYGGQYKRGGPDRGICLAQASLSYAIAPAGAAATFCLLWHVWGSISRKDDDKYTAGRWSFIRSVLIVGTPYVVFVAFGLAGAIVAVSDPAKVTLSPGVVFFCTIAPGPYPTSTSIGTVLFLIIAMYFEVRSCIALVNAARRSAKGKIDMQIVPRVLIFGAYIAFGFVFTIYSIITPTLTPDLYAGTLPVLIALLFGSQADVLELWRGALAWACCCCCRRRRDGPAVPEKTVGVASLVA